MRLDFDDLTTNGSGDASQSKTITGMKLLYMVEVNDGDLADGHTLTLTMAAQSGATYTLMSTTAGDTNSDIRLYPWATLQDTAADNVTAYTPQPIEGTLTVTIASGGDTKSGNVHLYLIDDAF